MSASRQEIQKAVTDVLAERFGEGVRIVRVSSSEDVDSDGDPILLVKVVYDAPSEKLDAREASGVVRYLLPRLRDIAESRFPILSFIAKSDAKALDPEAV